MSGGRYPLPPHPRGSWAWPVSTPLWWERAIREFVLHIDGHKASGEEWTALFTLVGRSRGIALATLEVWERDVCNDWMAWKVLVVRRKIERKMEQP